MKGQELFVLLVFLWQPEGSVRSVNLNSSSYGLQSQSVRKPAFGKNLIPCHSSTPSDWLLGFVSATPVFAVLCSDWLRSLLNCNPALQRICAVYTLRCSHTHSNSQCAARIHMHTQCETHSDKFTFKDPQWGAAGGKKGFLLLLPG